MQVYDKTKWHTEQGEESSDVKKRFSMIMDFLHKKNMLNDNGEEIYQLCEYNDLSIHSDMLTDAGIDFMDQYYDKMSEMSTDALKEIMLNRRKDSYV